MDGWKEEKGGTRGREERERRKKERRKKGKEPSEAPRAEGSRQTVRGSALRRNPRFTYTTWETHLLGVNNLTFQKSCFPSPPALSMEFSLHATWAFICYWFFLLFFVIPTTTNYGVNKEKLSFHIASIFFSWVFCVWNESPLLLTNVWIENALKRQRFGGQFVIRKEQISYCTDGETAYTEIKWCTEGLWQTASGIRAVLPSLEFSLLGQYGR